MLKSSSLEDGSVSYTAKAVIVTNLHPVLGILTDIA
jgi:hypothetical protein